MLVAVSVAAGLGWMAARNVRSPTQVALEAEPPTPSPITVEVERTELVADVITRADVGYDDPVPIGLAGALGGRPSTLVVTSARERGDELVEGAVAVEVSGRPVFLLRGEIPVYRDLLPQAEGPDVLQVEEALARLGHFSGEPDGVWTPATEAAVEAWYAAAGYQANGISDDDQHRIDTAGEAVTSAEDGVRTAEDRLESAEDRLAAAVRSEEDALYNLSEAREALDEARAGPGELAIRRARSALASAEEQEAFAEEDAVRRVAAAERAIIEAEADRERAAVDYTVARRRWESARLGVHPDTGNPPTGTQLEDLRQAVETALSALEGAERRIDEAYEDLDRRVIETDAAVRSAGDGVAEARSSLDDLLADPDVGAQVRAVENARNALDDARAEIEDARLAIDDARAGIEDAEAAVVEARESLKDLEDRTGVWIPAGELIFLERLPVRVDLLTAERGSSVTGPFMTVSGSELAIRGSVAGSDVALVREGGEAFIEDSLLVDPLRGEIRLVADRPGANNVAGSRYYIEIVADGIPDELVGSNVKVVIPVGGTAGEVLAVPAAALSSTAGSARVEVRQPDGTTRFVRVEPGLSAEGLVEITPLDGEIADGDLVVVGVASG